MLKSKLNANNKILAINTCPVAVLQYGFAVLEWRKEYLTEMYRKNKILMMMNGALHPKSDADKTYLSGQK